MSRALAQLNTTMTMWEDREQLDEIRKLFAPTLSELEFKFFIGLGRATRLNPFTREIWAVKYANNTPAQVYIGRDGYRKAAQSHSEYDFHHADAVYSNDDFEVNNGRINHKYKLTNRGELIGAYCIAKRHKSSSTHYVFVEFNEYTTGKSVWKDKPATMIKKVAESQCLRGCFQDLLGGTYCEEEMEHQSEPQLKVITGTTSTEKLNSMLDDRIEEQEIIIDGHKESLGKNDLIKRIGMLLYDKKFTQERQEKAIKYVLDQNKADDLLELSESQL